mgnify:CR=1 FL=1
MKWNACVDHSDSPARINLIVKDFLCFLIILSPTHNHASLEMSDEPEGLPVRDEVASIVTMLQCYMLHVTLRGSHCALPPRAGRVKRTGGTALTGGQEGDRDGLGRRARGIVVRIGENVFVAVVFAVRSALLLTFLLFSKIFLKKKKKYLVVSGKKRNFAA